jgi:RNA polymerase sigma-70 factor (ECF subfamily)
MSETKRFGDLIQEYHPMIYKICRVYSTSEDFDDLYQEILISVWKSLPSFQGRSKLSTWLYRVVLNKAMTYQRDQKKHESKISIDHIVEMQDGTTDYQEKEQQINRLYSAISQLKKDDRSIVLLYLDEKTYEEIAEITGLTTSNVGVKINRLKKKLFQILNLANNG